MKYSSGVLHLCIIQLSVTGYYYENRILFVIIRIFINFVHCVLIE